MSQKRIINDLEIMVIDGPCSGTGNSEVELGGTKFSQVRFHDGTRIAGLMADGYLAAFLEGRGQKFFVAEKGMRGYSMLLGVVDDEGAFHDIDGDTWSKSAKQTVVMGVIAIVIGIPLSAIAVGIPCIFMGMISVFQGLKLGKIVKAARAISDEHARPSSTTQSGISYTPPMVQAA